MVICIKLKVVVNAAYILTIHYEYMHDLFIVFQNGATPLYMASQNGHTNVVDVLLRQGADPNLATHVSNDG